MSEQAAVQFEDTSKGMIGIWDIKVYEGDIQRESIPLWQRAWNLFANIKWKLLKLPSSHYYRGKVLNKLVDRFGGKNLIVTVGKQVIMDRLFGLSAVAAVSRCGVGTNGTAAAVGNTALTGSFFKAFDATPTRSSLTVTCITTYGTSEANLNWQELGLDNGTTLLNRIAPIGPFNKTTAVSIIVTVTITQS